MPQALVDIKNSFDEQMVGGNAAVHKRCKSAITNNLGKELKGYYIESILIVPILSEGITVATIV